MKKTIIMILLIAALFISACGNEPQYSADASSQQDDQLSELSAEDRYVKFEADMACRVIKAGMQEDGEAVMQIMQDAPLIAQEYGLYEEDLNDLKDSATNDEFQEKVVAQMQSMCPEDYQRMLERAEE